LPNLINLSLNHAYDGEQLHFEEGGFRKLKRLMLRELKKIKNGGNRQRIKRGTLWNPALEKPKDSQRL
jgi:hypothetical protein